MPAFLLCILTLIVISPDAEAAALYLGAGGTYTSVSYQQPVRGLNSNFSGPGGIFEVRLLQNDPNTSALGLNLALDYGQSLTTNTSRKKENNRLIRYGAAIDISYSYFYFGFSYHSNRATIREGNETLKAEYDLSGVRGGVFFGFAKRFGLSARASYGFGNVVLTQTTLLLVKSYSGSVLLHWGLFH